MTPNTSANPLDTPQPDAIALAVNNARKVVLELFPDWWPRIHAGLATIAALRLEALDLCPTLVYTGPSGSGKSTLMDILTWNLVKGAGTIRIDSITPACFVSQNANQDG